MSDFIKRESIILIRTIFDTENNFIIKCRRSFESTLHCVDFMTSVKKIISYNFFPFNFLYSNYDHDYYKFIYHIKILIDVEINRLKSTYL
jgi:hypothetical protein